MTSKIKEKTTIFKLPKLKNILSQQNSVPTKRKEFDNINSFSCINEVKAPSDVWSCDSIENLPRYDVINLNHLDTEIIALKSGPDSGLDYVESLFRKKKIEINKIKFKRKQRYIYEQQFTLLEKKVGCGCVSLYEKNPITGKYSGDPIADSYLVCSRVNSSVLIVADGVNWGVQAKTASRCAIYGCYQYLEHNLFSHIVSQYEFVNRSFKMNAEKFTTHDVMQILHDSLGCAQQLILASNTPGLTTLCVCVVLPLINATVDGVFNNNASIANGTMPHNQFVVCCVNVGDSLAYLLSKTQGIREITVASHSTIDNRDFRDTGGALGRVYSDNSPELNNLTYSMTICNSQDIVLVTSDGISDNFDPVIIKKAMPPTDHLFPFIDQCECLHRQKYSWCNCTTHHDQLPCSATQINFTAKMELEPHERTKFAMKEIERVWHDAEIYAAAGNEINCLSSTNEPSSQELCESIVKEVLSVTKEKRTCLEKQFVAGIAKQPTTNDKPEANSDKLISQSDKELIDSGGSHHRRIFIKSHSTAGSASGPRHQEGGSKRHLRQKTIELESANIPTPLYIGGMPNPPPLPPDSLQLIPDVDFCPTTVLSNSSPKTNATVIPKRLYANPFPGKLDHATVVGSEVGDWSQYFIQSKPRTNNYNTSLANNNTKFS